MSFTVSAKILKYSESRETSKKIATFVVTVPKFVQAHINSRRTLSRNSASSRAMPAYVVRKRVLKDPFIPVEFGKNRAGMRGGEQLGGIKIFFARQAWLLARFVPCFLHSFCEKLGLHKEVTNRLIEPWMFVEVILTGTEWKNFIKLRADNAAQPEMQIIAKDIDRLLRESAPEILETGQWHLPFVSDEEKAFIDHEILLKVSAARCARVSYKLFDGKSSNPEKDIILCDRLIEQGHWSPFEHVAQASNFLENSGNFVGWKQYRKTFKSESGGNYNI